MVSVYFLKLQGQPILPRESGVKWVTNGPKKSEKNRGPRRNFYPLATVAGWSCGLELRAGVAGWSSGLE